MEFRKAVPMTLHAGQQRRHRCKEQTFGLNVRWKKLEPIIQSEVSQKEKDQYSTLKHIFRI